MEANSILRAAVGMRKTAEIAKITKTTNTSLPHTGIEDSTGTIVAIVALAIVGISSFVVIKKNSDI